MRKYLSEILGTFLYVLAGTGVLVFNGDPLWSALTFGLAIFTVGATFGRIEGGQYNPLITVTKVIKKETNILDGILYIISQIIGAILGSSILYAVFKHLDSSTEMLGQTTTDLLGNNLTLIIETVLGMVMVFMILKLADKLVDKKISELQYWGILGGIVTIFVSITINLTGGSLNFARSVAPAILGGNTEFITQLWVFGLATVLGGVLGYILYLALPQEVSKETQDNIDLVDHTASQIEKGSFEEDKINEENIVELEEETELSDLDIAEVEPEVEPEVDTEVDTEENTEVDTEVDTEENTEGK